MQSGPTGGTEAAITARDLITRLYIFADDSMMGRQFGTEGNLKGTQYIANELARMGVQPGGTNGTYFQDVPAFRVAPVRSAQLILDGSPLVLGTDFITSFPASGRAIVVDSLQTVYGGDLSDTTTLITADQAAGKAVLLAIRTPLQRNPGQILARYAGARAILTVNDPTTVRPYGITMSTDTTPARVNFVVSTATAARIFGSDPSPCVRELPGIRSVFRRSGSRARRHQRETSSVSSRGPTQHFAASTSPSGRTTITLASATPVRSTRIHCAPTTRWRTGSSKPERIRPRAPQAAG